MTGGNLLTDHPALYEARFPDPDRLAGRWAEDRLRRHGAGPRVLDTGCGTGRDAAHLHSAGRTVTGADPSEAMLAHTRSHHPGPTHLRADPHGFELRELGGDAFDAIVCLDGSLLYCHTNDQLDGSLGSCREALAPGGPLVAEMRDGAYFLGRTRVWTVEDGDEGDGGSDRPLPVEQRSAWRLLFPQELRHFLTAHGFEVLEVHDGPEPRTEPPWQDGQLPGAATDADRLHLVARLRTL